MNEVSVARITPNEMPVKDLGQILTRSGYFRDAKDYSQAVVKVLAGRELGLPPIASMMGIYFVQGKISLSAQTMAALIRRSGRYGYTVLRLDDQACEVEITEGGKGIGKSKFTMEDAKAAGLAHGDNWKKYPRNMLFARALSNAARWFCPDVFGGAAYTPDELGAIVDGETGEVDKPEAPVVVDVELEKPESPAAPLTQPVKDEEKESSESPAGDVSPADAHAHAVEDWRLELAGADSVEKLAALWKTLEKPNVWSNFKGPEQVAMRRAHDKRKTELIGTGKQESLV